MNRSSKQRFALVTGAGSGLGRAFCLRLARDRWQVAVTDLDGSAAEATLAEIVAAGGSGLAETLDVTDLEAWSRLREKLRNDWPRLDLLINNAGVCGSGEIGEGDLEQFRHIFEVNFFGTLHGCHTMAPWLKATAPGGHIVNIASIFGLISPPTLGAYGASKAAVIALSETLFGELTEKQIGVSVVAPGFFESRMIDGAQFADGAHRQIAASYLSESRLTADEVVDATLSAVERGRLYVVLGRKSRWVWRIKRWLPGWMACRVAASYRKRLRGCALGD